MTTAFLRTVAAPCALALAAALVPTAARAQDATKPQTVPVATLDAPTVLHACYIPQSGTTYRIKTPGAPDKCSKNHVEFSWNKEGIQGPQGPQGPQGEKGEPGAQGPAGASGALAFPFDTTLSHADPLLDLKQTGAGLAANFESSAATAVRGRSLTGAGVHGTTTLPGPNAAGVRAEHANEAGTALEIVRGGIRVNGMGLNTNTAAFFSRLQDLAPDQGGCAGCYVLTIDHPLANLQPDAVLMVTARTLHQDYFWGTIPPQKLAVRYNPGMGRWQIVVEYEDFDEAHVKGFNVLVLTP